LNLTDDIELLNLTLDLTLSSGFISDESINNLLAFSYYDIIINFYNLINGSINPLSHEKELIGTLNLGDFSLADLSTYGYQAINISKLDLLGELLNQERLYEALCSKNILLLEITSKFKGAHQGKWLDGDFAFEVLDAFINTRMSSKNVEINEAFVVSPEFVFNYSISDSKAQIMNLTM